MAVSFDLFGTLVCVPSPSDPAAAVGDALDERGVPVPADWDDAYRERHVDAPPGAETPCRHTSRPRSGAAASTRRAPSSAAPSPPPSTRTFEHERERPSPSTPRAPPVRSPSVRTVASLVSSPARWPAQNSTATRSTPSSPASGVAGGNRTNAPSTPSPPNSACVRTTSSTSATTNEPTAASSRSAAATSTCPTPRSPNSHSDWRRRRDAVSRGSGDGRLAGGRARPTGRRATGPRPSRGVDRPGDHTRRSTLDAAAPRRRRRGRPPAAERRRPRRRGRRRRRARPPGRRRRRRRPRPVFRDEPSTAARHRERRHRGVGRRSRRRPDGPASPGRTGRVDAVRRRGPSAAVESAAENLADGLVAPLAAFALVAPPRSPPPRARRGSRPSTRSTPCSATARNRSAGPAPASTTPSCGFPPARAPSSSPSRPGDLGRWSPPAARPARRRRRTPGGRWRRSPSSSASASRNRATTRSTAGRTPVRRRRETRRPRRRPRRTARVRRRSVSPAGGASVVLSVLRGVLTTLRGVLTTLRAVLTTLRAVPAALRGALAFLTRLPVGGAQRGTPSVEPPPRSPSPATSSGRSPRSRFCSRHPSPPWPSSISSASISSPASPTPTASPTLATRRPSTAPAAETTRRRRPTADGPS